MAADLDLPALIAWHEKNIRELGETRANDAVCGRINGLARQCEVEIECHRQTVAALRQLQSQGAAIRALAEELRSRSVLIRTSRYGNERAIAIFVDSIVGKLVKITAEEKNTMQPHQERVVTEKRELDEKLDKLKAFIETNATFKTLPEDEQGRLNRQFDAMAEYSSILGQRIAAF